MQHNPTDRTLRKKLADYLTGKVELTEFHDWFVSATWNIHLSAPLAVQQLAYEIQYLLDDYSYGSRSEDALKAKLRPLVTSLTVDHAKPASAGSFQNLRAGSKAKARKARRVSPGRWRTAGLPDIWQRAELASKKVKKVMVSGLSSAWAPSQPPLPSSAGRGLSVEACG